ncbi:uncharacterized protein LOC112197121 [Rosa chinensis]|uniref:uncharacterized protein LOC112197121 n=1 Tax=Rosa chinensis TaxID=74649 RepID=UPI000D095D48|nr:uncharacterized protein LOC112197121 [Rosa chinensis]
MVSIRISEEPFLRGLDRCKTNLIGRVTVPTKTPELVQHLRSLWSGLAPWIVEPLGRGFFMLQFNSLVDMQRVWSLGSVRLNSGMLRLIKWSPEFSPLTYKNTFAQVWVRLWDLGFAYWDQQTLFEIAAGVGTPLKLDPRTKNRTVGLYARVLIDVDFSHLLPDKLRITRANGEVVVIGVEYETEPEICSICGGIIGHLDASCRSAVLHNDDNVSQGRSLERSTLKKRKSAKSRRRRNLSKQVSCAPDKHLTVIKEVRLIPPSDQMEAGPLTIIPSESCDSVPPGFPRVTPVVEVQASSSTSTLVASHINPSTLVTDCNHALVIEQTDEIAREEGEFTPVLSKKSNKVLKQVEKSKKKVSRKPTGQALISMGAGLRHL